MSYSYYSGTGSASGSASAGGSASDAGEPMMMEDEDEEVPKMKPKSLKEKNVPPVSSGAVAVRAVNLSMIWLCRRVVFSITLVAHGARSFWLQSSFCVVMEPAVSC